jgi:hypothetical protein
MPKMRRLSGFVALSVCLFASGWGDTVFADEPQANRAVASTPTLDVTPTQQFYANSASRLVIGEHALRAMTVPEIASQPLQSTTLAQRRGYGGYGGYGRRRNGASQAEMILGAAAAITGAALLTYANRPECSVNALADGCSYGTKVVGTAVTAGGIVTFLTGALTWR